MKAVRFAALVAALALAAGAQARGVIGGAERGAAEDAAAVGRVGGRLAAWSQKLRAVSPVASRSISSRASAGMWFASK